MNSKVTWRLCNKINLLLARDSSFGQILMLLVCSIHTYYVLSLCRLSFHSASFSVLAFITAGQRSCGKVVFSVMPVCSLHWTSLYRVPALPTLHICLPPNRVPTPPSLKDPVPSDTWWPRTDTCSNLSTWRPHCEGCPDHCLHLVIGYVWWSRGW